MTQRLFIVILLVMINVPLFGTMVQFINNVPNQKLDIYLNDQLQFSQMQFRQGTAFFELPAGTWQLKVTTADTTEAVHSRSITLTDDTNYVLMLAGDLEDLQILIKSQHRFNSDADQHIGMSFVHAALGVDSVTLSIAEQAVWEHLKFGTYTPYTSIPASPFAIVVEDATRDEGLISNWIKLDFWQQKSAVIFTSGYADGRAPRLKTYVMLSNGISFPLEEIPLPSNYRKVQVQFIQNAPQQAFDLYLNDELFIPNFEAHHASRFLDLPKGEYFSIGLASANSSSRFDIQNYLNFKFDADTDYIIFLNGDEEGTLTFPRIKNQVPKDVLSTSVATAFAQAALHLDALDVYIDGEKMYENINRWNISDYELLPSRPFRLEVRPIGAAQEDLAAYQVDLSAWRGERAMLYTSTNTTSFPYELELHLVLPDTAFLLTPLAQLDGIEDRAASQQTNWLDATVLQNQIQIAYQNQHSPQTKFMLSDAQAKQLMEQMTYSPIGTKHDFRMDVSQLGAGIYFLQAVIDQKVYTKKIVLP